MKVITDDIERALKHETYYLAIIGSLSLPDICAALESENGETSGPKYKAWCDVWLKKYRFMATGEDFWNIRCGVLHQGQFAHKRLPYSRVMFVLPNTKKNIVHNALFEGMLTLSAAIFCESVIEATGTWYEAKKDDQFVKVNFPRLVRYHTHGLAPYIMGNRFPCVG